MGQCSPPLRADPATSRRHSPSAHALTALGRTLVDVCVLAYRFSPYGPPLWANLHLRAFWLAYVASSAE